MGILGCMRGNRHITGHRNEEAGFHVGLVVVVNRSSDHGARYGYAGPRVVGPVEVICGKTVNELARRMCHGLRVPGQRERLVLSGTKFPRARFVEAGHRSRAEERDSRYHTRFRSRDRHSAEESGMDLERDRKDRIWRVPRDNVPRAPRSR